MVAKNIEGRQKAFDAIEKLIADGEPIRFLELSKKIHSLKKVDFKPKFLPERDYDTKRRQPDISKIKENFPDYKFISIDEGLKLCL